LQIADRIDHKKSKKITNFGCSMRQKKLLIIMVVVYNWSLSYFSLELLGMPEFVDDDDDDD
jgi:hypothetical protein